jgi:hypothetical protein
VDDLESMGYEVSLAHRDLPADNSPTTPEDKR